VLLLPDPLGGVFGQMMRDREMLLEEFANALHLHPDDAYSIGGILVEKGYFALEEQDDERGLKYRVNFAPMRKRDLPEL
jgi:hypothetical protein